jgi:hypothetical protein
MLVLKLVSRIERNSLAPASTVHDAAPTNYGVMAIVTLDSTTKFNDGAAETANSDFPTLKT